ncbi:hypothetical protein KC19_2G223000 [Ceratodon purpureus]|uniref:Protein kinase domain-containing protein n=1 Tax=Ceratodon purpureus TaxID=3225 RepID=A0A8T0IWT2_CERPU|nr:hypothetical protein KC19_2G223000 [Ceratodon purpureus]
MRLSREIVPHLLLAASGQLHSSFKCSKRNEIQPLLAVASRLFEYESRATDHMNKQQCRLLSEKLLCILKWAQRTNISATEPLFHELHGIVTSAETLIELCDCNVGEAHSYRLISFLDSREAFAEIFSKMVWYATEFLLQRDFLGILRQALADMWQLELREAASEDHKSEHLRPTLVDVKRSDIEVEYMHAIGHGAFGRVFKAMWLGAYPCAVKELDCGNDKTFKLEASVLSSLHHPNIVHFIGCLEDERSSALVMELMDYDLTYLFRKYELGLDVIVAVDIMLQAAQGMRYLHAADIVHRDLKAANILIKEVNKFAESRVGCYSVKLTDFGLARTKVKFVETVWSYKVGTLRWRAPELLEMISEDRESIDHPVSLFFPKQTDVYSFAITCSEILTCKTPYSELENSVTGISTMQLRQKILQGRRPLLPSNGLPEQLVSLIERCWDGNPDRRPNFDVICFVLQQIKASLLTERRIALKHGQLSNTPFKSTSQVYEPHQFQHVSYTALRLQTI